MLDHINAVVLACSDIVPLVILSGLSIYCGAVAVALLRFRRAEAEKRAREAWARRHPDPRNPIQPSRRPYWADQEGNAGRAGKDRP